MNPEDDMEMRRRRARYRAWHRGTREMDLLLGRFADAALQERDRNALSRVEILLELPDTDLLKWIIGQEPPPADVDRELLAELTEFHARPDREK